MWYNISINFQKETIIQIQILSITQGNQPTKTPGKTTPFLDIAFKNLTFQGKVEGKKLFSFGGNAGGYKVLIGAQPGEVYEVEVVKNDAGYNDWSSAKKSDGTQPTGPTASASPAARNTMAPTASPKSTYETPEERAKKQIYIVRQSSLSNAIDVLSVGSKTPPKLEDVLSVAKTFEDFVFGTTQSAAVAVENSFDELDTFDDLPQ